MLELPEAVVIAEQIKSELRGKKIVSVDANRSPHKFAWFHGDPDGYPDLLNGREIETAASYGGLVEVTAGQVRIVFGDGVNIRYLPAKAQPPAKHQLLLRFDDSSSLVGSVQMYGGLWAFLEGEFNNPYYSVAREKPSPLGYQFDYGYFEALLAGEKASSLSAKAFLATEQRIPGLGNGILQDILWTARIHPRQKIGSLSGAELESLFKSVKSVTAEMAACGGRDTEKDLYGCPGGYSTILSKKTVGGHCPACGKTIKKEAYMGGSVYYCTGCQRV